MTTADPGISGADATLRIVAARTLVAVAASVLPTVAILMLTVGADLGASVAVGRVWVLALAMASLAPMTICPLMALSSGRRLAELRRARDELTLAAQIDPLTGLMNRRGFDDAAARLLDDPALDGRPVVAVMCDVDRFKLINDKYGHDFGDTALARIAGIIQDAFGSRPSLLSRRGGEEFAILLPDCAPEAAMELAQAAREACDATVFAWDGFSVRVTTSFGVAFGRHGEADLRALLGEADAALYQAKRDGRNRVVQASTQRRAREAA